MRFVYDYRGRQAAKSFARALTAASPRFYDALAETAGGFDDQVVLRSGRLRVASQSSNYIAWETASLDRGPV